MARIAVPDHLLRDLGPEMKMDVHWVDVRLSDGRTFANLVVRGGRYLTGRASDINGEGHLPFSAADIAAVSRHSPLPRALLRVSIAIIVAASVLTAFLLATR